MTCPNTLVDSTKMAALPINYLRLEGLSIEDILYRASASNLIRDRNGMRKCECGRARLFISEAFGEQ